MQTQSGPPAAHTPLHIAAVVSIFVLARPCRCMLFDAEAVKANRNTLRHMSEFGSLMVRACARPYHILNA